MLWLWSLIAPLPRMSYFVGGLSSPWPPGLRQCAIRCTCRPVSFATSQMSLTICFCSSMDSSDLTTFMNESMNTCAPCNSSAK
mgnify:CR=1 FL=1